MMARRVVVASVRLIFCMDSGHILLEIHTVSANMHDFHNGSPEAMATQRKTHESIQNL
jgi:hypothetical protein